MSTTKSKEFKSFVKKNNPRITTVVELIKDFIIGNEAIESDEARKRVLGWIENFDKIGYDDFDLALILLENIDFLTTNHIYKKIISRCNTFLGNCYIAPLGEISESSFHLTAGQYKNPKYKVSLKELLEFMPESGENQILFIDDFLNSGSQVISIFYALLGVPLPTHETTDEYEKRMQLKDEALITKLRNSKIHLGYYLAFDEGKKKIIDLLVKKQKLNIEVHSYAVSNYLKNPFGDEEEQQKIRGALNGKARNGSVFKGIDYKRIKPFYKILINVGKSLLIQNEPQWPKKKYDERKLGYGNLASLIITERNVPTITLTALWQKGKIKVNRNEIEWKELLPRSKKVLPEIEGYENRSNDCTDSDINKYADELQTLYEQDSFSVGYEKAKVYFKKCSLSDKLLMHILRFGIRQLDTDGVKEITNSLLKKDITDRHRALCLFALFECELSEANDFRFDSQIYTSSLKTMKRLLLSVPSTQKTRRRFYYLEGRMQLENWWAHMETNNISYLTKAIVCFKSSIDIRYDWWAHCYLCIALKIKEDSSLTTQLGMFETNIKRLIEKYPDRQILKLYFITALILSENELGLMNYLKKIKRTTTPSGIEGTLIHRVELIFSHNSTLKKKYIEIIENWIYSLVKNS